MKFPKHVLRPIREADHEGLTHLVGTIGHGLTSLPKDPDFLGHRINDSLRAFDPRVRKPGGETYLFVLEDLESGAIVGTSGLLSRVGGFDPFYTYTIHRHVQDYEPLDIHIELETLQLTRNHKGPTEICSLFLHADHRSGGMGRLLSLARFLFMKTFRERFDDEVIAELRGFIDDNGHPPFWEAVGQKFFQNDYYTADILSGVGEKEFIEALMPKFPIYITLLPESARRAIGRVHPHTEPARRILLGEGFRETSEVDIFDAGPILKARTGDLASWRNSREVRLVAGRPDAGRGQKGILANRALDFRATLACIEEVYTDCLRTPPETLGLLALESGDTALFLPART